MISLENLIGLMLVVLTAGFLMVFSLQNRRQALPIRNIQALKKIVKSIGTSVEDGRRIHFSFGRGEFLGYHAAGVISNTAALEEITRRTLGSDRPPALTSGNAVSTILAGDILNSASRMGFTQERIDARRARLAGVTPMSYAAGVLPGLLSEQTSTMILGGSLGIEMRLLLDTAENEQVRILAAPDSLIGQAIAFASPSDILVGEEIFALPAFLRERSVYSASLLAQDSLRWLVISFLLLGAALRSIGLQIP